MDITPPSECPPYLVDTDAIIGLGCCDAADIVFKNISFTITVTCHNELKHKPTDRTLSRVVRDGARTALEHVTNDPRHKQTVIHGGRNTGYNEGERSIVRAITRHPHFDRVLLYDKDAYAMIENTIRSRGIVVDTVPPNDPLYIIADQTNLLTREQFCENTAQILTRRNWWGSHRSHVFWDYDIPCPEYRQ